MRFSVREQMAYALSMTVSLIAVTPFGIAYPFMIKLMPYAYAGSTKAVLMMALVWVGLFSALSTLLRAALNQFAQRSDRKWQRKSVLGVGAACGLVAACVGMISDSAVQFISGKTFVPPLLPGSLVQWALLSFVLVVFSAAVESGVLALIFRGIERSTGRVVGFFSVTVVSALVGAAHSITGPVLSVPTAFLIFVVFGWSWIVVRSSGGGAWDAAVAMIAAHMLNNFFGIVRSVLPWVMAGPP